MKVGRGANMEGTMMKNKDITSDMLNLQKALEELLDYSTSQYAQKIFNGIVEDICSCLTLFAMFCCDNNRKQFYPTRVISGIMRGLLEKTADFQNVLLYDKKVYVEYIEYLVQLNSVKDKKRDESKEREIKEGLNNKTIEKEKLNRKTRYYLLGKANAELKLYEPKVDEIIKYLKLQIFEYECWNKITNKDFIKWMNYLIGNGYEPGSWKLVDEVVEKYGYNDVINQLKCLYEKGIFNSIWNEEISLNENFSELDRRYSEILHSTFECYCDESKVLKQIGELLGLMSLSMFFYSKYQRINTDLYGRICWYVDKIGSQIKEN